jgi:hypothetical protein
MWEFRILSAAQRRSAVLLWSGAAALVLVSGCVANSTAAAADQVARTPAASPVASPSPTGVTQGARDSASSSTVAAATPALPPVAIDVSPPQVRAGDVTLAMAVEPARRMFGQPTAQATDADPAHQTTTSAGQVAMSTFVLDGMLRLTNNIDASQPVPDDEPQSIVRHVNVQIRNGDASSSVPYLSASVDMLLDGRPILANVPLMPMVAAEATTPVLYYGNNLKLTQRGTYQAFVRLQRSALLGKEPPPAAQFNVVVR